MKLPVAIAVFVSAAGLGSAPLLRAQTADSGPPAAVAALEQTLVEVISATEPSVVAIARTPPRATEPMANNIFGEFRNFAVADEEAVTTGAGVIIDAGGLVLTQYLAIQKGETHRVITTAGKSYSATIRAADPRSGLAVLAMDLGGPAESPPLPAIRFGDAAQLRKGHFVVAIGNPYAIRADGQPSASWGIVTNLSRKAPPGTNLNDAPGPPPSDYRTTLHHLGTLIQTDASLGWNAGGGALINLRGELVGLTTTTAAIAGHEQPAGYAIPINASMRRIIETLKEGREVEYGLLGVSFSPTPFAAATVESQRLTVQQVLPGTPAARAGIQNGDIVTHVADQRVDQIDALQLAVSLIPPAETALIRYRRNGEEASAEITLTKLPVVGEKIVSQRPPAWRGIHVDYPTVGDTLAMSQDIAAGRLDPEGCVLIVEVEPESDAAAAGIRAGMYISHVGAQRVSTPAEFRNAVRSIDAINELELTEPLDPPANRLPGPRLPGRPPER